MFSAFFSSSASASRPSWKSTRSTDYITPKFAASRAFRDATLALAKDFPFARSLINSGRLSVPTAQTGSPLDTPDADTDWKNGPGPGRAMLDAPLGNGWLVDRLGLGFSLLSFGAGAPPADVAMIEASPEGLMQQRYDARPGTAYLIRPDRYVAARWRRPTADAIAGAVRRAPGSRASR